MKILCDGDDGANKWTVYLLIFILAWLAYFYYSFDFGFYEDDYELVATPFNLNLRENVERLINKFQVNQLHGRVIGHAMIAALSFLSYKLGGLKAAYMIAFLIVSLNSIIFYHLLKRRFPFLLALFGAMIFLLFPVDTTKAFLTHSFCLQTSFTFILAACHLYLSGKKWPAYLVSTASLLSYEITFLPFIFIPFFSAGKWDKKFIKAFVKHAAVAMGLIAAVIIMHLVFKEYRMSQLKPIVTVKKIMVGSVVGPPTALLSFIIAPLECLRHLKAAMPFIMAAFFILSLYFHIFLRNGFSGPKTGDAKKAFLIGVIMLMTAYAFSFSHFPVIIRGRLTSVHIAATFGAALLAGSLLYIFFRKLKEKGLVSLAVIFSSLYLALLVGYGSLIQQDFRQSWANQRSFWTRVVELCPDLADYTVILLYGEDLKETRYINTHSWADAIMLDKLYNFPKSWKRDPMVIMLEDRWDSVILVEGSSVRLSRPGSIKFMYPDFNFFDLKATNTIFLEINKNIARRINEPMNIGGRYIAVKKLDGNTVCASPPKSNIYDYLILTGGGER